MLRGWLLDSWRHSVRIVNRLARKGSEIIRCADKIRVVAGQDEGDGPRRRVSAEEGQPGVFQLGVFRSGVFQSGEGQPEQGRRKTGEALTMAPSGQGNGRRRG
jgi:hypothetical protein